MEIPTIPLESETEGLPYDLLVSCEQGFGPEFTPQNLSSGKKSSYIQSGTHHSDYICAVPWKRPVALEKIIVKCADLENGKELLNGAQLQILYLTEENKHLVTKDEDYLKDLDSEYKTFKVIEVTDPTQDLVFSGFEAEILAIKIKNAGGVPLFKYLTVGKLCLIAK
jgi:hypothetical protein